MVLTSLNHAGVGSDPAWREEWRQQAAWGAEACLCQDVRADTPRWRQLGFAARAARAVGKVVWQHQGGMQDRHGRPFEEAAMAATGELARRAGSELKDHRGWGRWSGRLFHACDATVAVISVQAPCHSANAGGAWVRQEEELHKQGGGGKGREEKPDPGEVMLQELGKVVGELRAKGIAVLLGGDWNREWGGSEKKGRRLKEWAEEAGLVNPMAERWAAVRPHTRQAGKERGSALTNIDHWLVDKKLWLAGVVQGVGVHRGTLNRSDHRAILLRLTWGGSVGGLQDGRESSQGAEASERGQSET